MLNRYIALVPAYEPAELMMELLPRLQEANFEIVIVDDGSGPDYASIFERASAYGTVLTHPQNRGKGAALKTGYTYIRENCGEERIIVAVDADGQHRVEDALRLCKSVEEFPDALHLGGRKFKGDVPLRSRFGNTMTRLVYRLSTGLKVHDTQTGLRACSTRLLPEMLAISGDRYEYEMNVLLDFSRKRIPIKEIEIETIYIDNNATSHFNTLKDSFRVYKEIIKFSASSLIGFLVDYSAYSLMVLCKANLWASNITARVISSVVNYTLNRKFVFKNKGSIAKSALEYFGLAAVILVGNTLVLDLLVNTCGLHQMLAKIVTEIVFFMLSFTVQRCFIFKKAKKA